ncbi:MAG: helix-turn-helix transcriptional regulator [Oscillospiraceae bacterium]|nr:helix-turn-helix transcriptional regulator [Oscillospiraceae bacterium]
MPNHEAAGRCPNQYITKLRMVYAANLLRNSDNDILTISLKSGYTSMSHFVATFKKYYGLSPSRFRQQHSNMADWK